MTKKEAKELGHGLCRIYWRIKNGGGTSLAAVGSNSQGDRWYAPTNWVSVPIFDWEIVERVEWIEKSEAES